jgi:hypothetical protein
MVDDVHGSFGHAQLQAGLGVIGEARPANASARLPGGDARAPASVFWPRPRPRHGREFGPTTALAVRALTA